MLGRWQCALVAVKVLREECTEPISPAELEAFRQEAQILQDMHHPYILNNFGACLDCKPVRAIYTCMLLQTLQYKYKSMICTGSDARR